VTIHVDGAAVPVKVKVVPFMLQPGEVVAYTYAIVPDPPDALSVKEPVDGWLPEGAANTTGVWEVAVKVNVTGDDVASA
jgi:hypothetical protein